MKNGRQEVGKRGEDEVCAFLQREGHTILERNWRSGHLEIDIISRTGNEVHIVEVKSRTAPVPAAPEINVGPEKRSRLVRATLCYLNSEDRPGIFADAEIFFDIATVVFEDGIPLIEYYPRAFIPIYYGR